MFAGIWRLYKKSGKRCQVLWKFQSSADSRNLQGNLYILLLWYSIMIQYYVFFTKYLVFLIYCAVVKPKKYPPFCQNWFCYSLLPRKGEYNPEIFTFFFYKIKLFRKKDGQLQNIFSIDSSSKNYPATKMTKIQAGRR